MILIVADSALARQVILRALGPSTGEALAFDSARQAQEALSLVSPRAVVVHCGGFQPSPFSALVEACARAQARVVLLAEEQADLSWCEPYAALGQFGVLRTPFREGELREALAPVPRNGNESTVSIGSFRLYGDKSQLEGEGGSVSLTPTEFRLVHYLIEHRGSPVSSDQLLEDVWGWPPGTGSGEVVRAHVRNLRAKVRQLDGGQELIRNYPRRGYAIPPELEVRASSL